MTVSSYKGRRDKGIAGEREVRHRLEKDGFDVRGLEGKGDHLATKLGADGPVILHVEVKRQETLRVDDWHRQAMAEAPAVAIPTLIYRRSGEPWRAVVLLDDLLKVLK